MVYLKSVENVITLGKLIGLLFLFCLPLLSILFLKTKRNDLARPVMGTIFLVYIYIYIYHAKSRLNTPVWGSLRSPNYEQVISMPLHDYPWQKLLQTYFNSVNNAPRAVIKAHTTDMAHISLQKNCQICIQL